MDKINVHEQFGAKCFELGEMKKLKKIEIDVPEEIRNFRENLLHLTIVEDWHHLNFSRHHLNFSLPADPFKKFSSNLGFWEISCKPVPDPVSLFSNR